MIAHEHPRMRPPTAAAANLSQPTQEDQAVVVGFNYRFPAITTGHHMIDRARILKTSLPCHGVLPLAGAIASSWICYFAGTDPRPQT